jgi:hypothetical protein
MNSCDYYLLESVDIVYDGGGETVSSLRIHRSKQPRWFPEEFKSSGMTREAWVEENEELMTRVIYEKGEWNVPDWQTEYYKEELEDLKVALSEVLTIKRVVSCRFYV